MFQGLIRATTQITPQVHKNGNVKDIEASRVEERKY